MANDIRCAVIEIHGIGNQKPDWSKDFDTALTGQLTDDEQARLARKAVWWADLSRLPGASPTAAVPTGGATSTTATRQAYVDYAHHLAGASGAPAGGPADLGSTLGGIMNRVIKLKNDPVTVADHIADVANYVGNNKIRLAVQERLSAALFGMQADHPDATLIIASHSQGTIIAYDMVRLLAGQLPVLKVWVSMGCPLGWYLPAANWGDNTIELPATLRWINLYDPQDIVGQDLDRLAHWTPAVPEDINVNNVAQGLDPHDHWHNPVVVDKYVELIRAAIQ
jgi:hypothetical protein